MHKLLVTSLILAIAGAAFGQLSGSLSGTLGPGIYDIVDTISVESGDSLRLMPATTFVFDGPYPFNINGTLLAEGTENNSIVFTTDTLANPSRWRGMRFYSGSSGSQLAYCLVEKGYATGGSPQRCGGGVYCDNSSPTFTDCFLRGNTASWGGAVFCGSNSSPSFSNCTINSNLAEEFGGGVHSGDGCSPTFMNCTIRGNYAVLLGGGVECGGVYGGSVTLTNCTICDNRVDWWGGGGISCSLLTATLTNCIISNNSVYSYWGAGGGLYCGYGSVIVRHCTISGNAAVLGGGVYCSQDYPPTCFATFNSAIIAFSEGPGILFNTAGHSEVQYCDIFRNSGGDIVFCNNDPSHGPPGIGRLVTTNTNDDSCDSYYNIFLNPLLADTAAGDFHLTDFSHCIGAGSQTDPPATDYEGDIRPDPPGSNPDIGADEHWLAGPAFHIVIWIKSGNAILKWWSPEPLDICYIYGATAPFIAGELLDTVSGTTTWTDVNTLSRPSPYFYYVTVVE